MAQYTQRISDQQVEIESLKAANEAAAVREAELRGALTEAMEKVVDNFGVAYDAIDIDRWESILANPSPLAKAVRENIGKDAIREFIAKVERRAERKMEITHKLEGAHYAAMKELEREMVTDDPARGPIQHPAST